MPQRLMLWISRAWVERLLPNRWDVVAFAFITAIAFLLANGVHQGFAPLQSLQAEPISLNPAALPGYALRTTLRLFAGMVLALLFTLTYGTLAAKSQWAGKVLVPLLDILQSVPVLGYLSFTLVFFLALFPGRVAGAESAAIFAIFTAQAWNMTFSFYHSLRTLPQDLEEVARSFHLSAWQRFWKLDVPFAMPGLIWNMMMSMSGAWFFIVASEAITIGSHTIQLPGIGAYLAQAIAQKNLTAVGWVVLAMVIVIVAYDQFLFRPLVAWADKFRLETTGTEDVPQSWVLNLIHHTRLMRRLCIPISTLLKCLARLPLRQPAYFQQWSSRVLHIPDLAKQAYSHIRQAERPAGGGNRSFSVWDRIQMHSPAKKLQKVLSFSLAILATLGLGYLLGSGQLTLPSTITWHDIGEVLFLGSITLIRVFVLILLASLIWVPLGVWIGLRPGLSRLMQPLVQFLAAFPANLLFPVFVVLVVRFHLNADIWLSPLIILGAQWYILFNVIAGTMAFPNDFREAAANFQIRGKQWWKQVMLPGIFPYYVTGAITASGGAWNASIVSEAVDWGDTQLFAHGLGAYITQKTQAGDYPHLILGILTMVIFVTLLNRMVWRPLYQKAENMVR